MPSRHPVRYARSIVNKFSFIHIGILFCTWLVNAQVSEDTLRTVRCASRLDEQRVYRPCFLGLFESGSAKCEAVLPYAAFGEIETK